MLNDNELEMSKAQNVSYYLDLSINYYDSGQTQKAIQVVESGLTYFPKDVLLLNRLGNLYQSTQQITRALTCYQQAINSQSDAAITYNNLGILFVKLSHFIEAEQAFSEALYYRQDNYLPAWYNLGKLYSLQQQYDRAQTCYERALSIDNESAPVYISLAENWIRLGNVKEARVNYEKALLIETSDGVELQKILLLPPIYQSLQELNTYRTKLIQNLEALSERDLNINDPLNEVNKTLFYLPYQGQNDYEIMGLFTKVLSPILSKSQVSVTISEAPISQRKIRIGFISRYFNTGSVMDCFSNHILGLSKEDFHIQLFAVPETLEDQLTQQLKDYVDDWFLLPERLSDACSLIGQQSLDILVYTDLGVEPYSFYLAFFRLARQQYVLSGMPNTTGIPTIDFFVSSELEESSMAQNYYHEHLIVLKGVCVNYSPLERLNKLKSRKELGLPLGKNLYICPMTLFKVHPEFDYIILEILKRDPEGVVIFFEYKQTDFHQLLKKRFKKFISPVIKQIHFHPWVSQRDLLHIICQADVVLDTIHYGGGNTAFQTLAMGTPIVTWPSPYCKGRVAYALYYHMEMFDCIASTFDEYVKLANKIAQNPELRARLSAKILARNEILFNNSEAVDELSQVYKRNLGIGN